MLNVAVVGMGWWGKTLVSVIANSSKLKVVKGVKRDPATEAEFARAHDFEITSDYAAALKDPRVQGVLLCTPHTLHADQIVAAAQAGKHVFCEKPLSMSRAEVLRAVAAVKANKVALAVGHERRFEPPILDLMRTVKSGELGVPLQVEANFSQDRFLNLPPDNWRLTAKEAPAGPLTATGIHILDLSVAVFGAGESVLCSVKQLGSQLANGDTLAALVSFKNGGHALLTAVLATPFDGRFAVYCSKGWIEVRDKAHPGTPQGWTVTKVVAGDKRSTVEYPPVSSVLANLEAFADAAEGRAPYLITQDEMVATISALEAMIASAATGTKVVVK
ncbi:MAG TPA: Gfo/Idh/MocA family oxidoreductase [Burkholderiales bacterium]|nr:Gfo/Idh/MocA family oxidoreductase [Burkholderiales bacterium]